jgi:uncharacterized protein YndB with AHSA1/START domain
VSTHTQATATSVRSSIVVEAPIERAFAVFVDDFGAIKPPEHNLLGVELAATVFEAKAGGRVFDRGVDGSECHWARVIAYEPPERIVLGWHIDQRWQIETDPARTSEVEIRFVPETSERTRVELEHRNFERHGDGWEGVRDGVGDARGWPLYLQRYAGLV